jgi:hypothetical protein
MKDEFAKEDRDEGQDHSKDPRRKNFLELYGNEGSAGSSEPTTSTTSAGSSDSTTSTTGN